MSSPRLYWHLFIYSRVLQIRYAIIWRVTTERRHDGIAPWYLFVNVQVAKLSSPLSSLAFGERVQWEEVDMRNTESEDGKDDQPHPLTLSFASPCAITGARHEEWVGGGPHRIAAQHNDEWERFPVRDPITRMVLCKKTLFTQEAEDYTPPDSDNQDKYVDRRGRSCWLTGESQSSPLWG